MKWRFNTLGKYILDLSQITPAEFPGFHLPAWRVPVYRNGRFICEVDLDPEGRGEGEISDELVQKLGGGAAMVRPVGHSVVFEGTSKTVIDAIYVVYELSDKRGHQRARSVSPVRDRETPDARDRDHASRTSTKGARCFSCWS